MKVYEYEKGMMINGDTIDGMDHVLSGMGGGKPIIDIIVTSPPYNTMGNRDDRGYDMYTDDRSDHEYIDWIVDIFNKYNQLLVKDGVILFNMSYGATSPSLMIQTINEIIESTDFMVVDMIAWKKKNATPNASSPNLLTRLCEFVYVIVRKSESKTFTTNRRIKSIRPNGQKNYTIDYNFIEADNNDGPTELNKATFSTQLVDKLLTMYYVDKGKRSVIMDNFSGTGTSLVSSMRFTNTYFVGIELSDAQCDFADKRINNNEKIAFKWGR